MTKASHGAIHRKSIKKDVSRMYQE